MNQKAQAMASFRLLIAAVMAVMILGIILGAVSYLGKLRGEISTERIATALASGVKQPNGDVLVVKKITLKEGTISNRAVAEQTKIDKDCVAFDARKSDTFKVSPSSVTITKSVEANVYIQCGIADKMPEEVDSSDCEIGCLVSFDKQIQSESLDSG